MNSDSVRVRFAPSPTGFLHIGSVRAALFNWLYAKNKKGRFLLRIEDTDLERSTDAFTRDILSTLQWLGLLWDEEPWFQSQRTSVYQKAAEELVAQGFAYRCDCSEQEVDEMRQKAMQAGDLPRYDRRCRDLQKSPGSRPFVIRAKIPLEGHIEFEDRIRGKIVFNNKDLDDFVILRSNQLPTYHLSVVVDDVQARMTHILRGDDHINNTPKQVHLYRFFNYPVPQFAHLPIILGPDKKKLSKRHGSVSVSAYRAEGFLPEALLNFLARLGWSHGDQEIFDLSEMIQFFSLEHVQKSAAVFNREKLLWLNGAHLRRATPERLRSIILEDFLEYFSPEAIQRARTPLGLELLQLIQPKVKLVKELAQQWVPLCTPGVLHGDVPEVQKADSGSRSVIQAAIRHFLEQFHRAFSQGSEQKRPRDNQVWGDHPSLKDLGWSVSEIETMLQSLCQQHGISLRALMTQIRLGLTGPQVNAGLFEVLWLLPQDLIEERLKKMGG